MLVLVFHFGAGKYLILLWMGTYLILLRFMLTSEYRIRPKKCEFAIPAKHLKANIINCSRHMQALR